MSLLFGYMFMRLPFIPWSIVGVPSSQALPGYLITVPPSVCVPDVIRALACGFNTKTKNRPTRLGAPNRRHRSIVFRVLFQQINKQTNQRARCFRANIRLSVKSTSTRDTFNTREWQTTGLRSLWPRRCPGVHYY